jgi:hypothetical protein
MGIDRSLTMKVDLEPSARSKKRGILAHFGRLRPSRAITMESRSPMSVMRNENGRRSDGSGHHQFALE